MKYMKGMGLIVAVMIYFSVLYGQDDATRQIINASVAKLTEALKTHNFSVLEPLLDEDFTLGKSACGGYCNSNIQAMKMIISDYPYKVKKITIDAIKPEATDFRLMTTVTFKKEKDEKQEILISQEGKFLEMSIPKIRLRFVTPEAEGSETGVKKSCCPK